MPTIERPIRVESFSLVDDQIAISVPGITSYELKSNLSGGNLPTNMLLLQNRTETTPDGYSQTVGEILIVNGTAGSQATRILAELPGVDVDTLTPSNFRFNTTGTLYDSTLNSSGHSYNNPVPVL